MLSTVLALVVVSIIGLAIAVGVYLYRQEQKRIALLVNFCASEGWQFSREDPYGLVDRWDGMPFGKGYARHVQNVVSGTYEDMQLVAFDYSYKEDSGSGSNRNTTTYRYVVVALGMPCALPEVSLTPEGLFSRIGNVLGFQDIELESEEFNRRYRVRCENPKLAMDVLTPRTMEFLLANDVLAFRLVGPDALSYDSARLSPYAIMSAAHMLAGVVKGVPAFVWDDHRAPRSPA